MMARQRGLRVLLRAVLLLALLSGCASAPPPAEDRRSGAAYMGAALQALQNDDTQNPAMLWVAEGAQLWAQRAGRADRSCADCHGEAALGMRGVAARHPAFDSTLGRAQDLGQRIQQCRERRQQAEPFAPESAPLLALEMFIARQSRGMPLAPPPDARLAAARRLGAQLFGQRMGQLELACAHCHDARAGLRLGGNPIPQAHPDGYPVYRIAWQGPGSLQRRIRNCMSGVRAEPFAYGSQEMVALALHLAERARGMPLDAPGVRP